MTSLITFPLYFLEVESLTEPEAAIDQSDQLTSGPHQLSSLCSPQHWSYRPYPAMHLLYCAVGHLQHAKPLDAAPTE